MLVPICLMDIVITLWDWIPLIFICYISFNLPLNLVKVGDILILLIRKTEVQFSVRGGIPVSDASVLFFFTSIWLSEDVLPHTSSKASFWSPLFFYSCFSKWIEPYQNAFIERCAYSIAVSIIWQFLHYSTITKSLVGIIQQCSVIWESFSAGKYSLSFK